MSDRPPATRSWSDVIDRQRALNEAMRWLRRRIDAGSYDGNRSPIVTLRPSPRRLSVMADVVIALFDHALLTGDRSSFERGVRMAESLLTAIGHDRLVSSTSSTTDDPAPSPGPVLRGLLRAARETGDCRFLERSHRLAGRLADDHDGDGPPSSLERMAALVEAWEAFGEERFLDAVDARSRLARACRDDVWLHPGSGPGDTSSSRWASTGMLAGRLGELLALATIRVTLTAADASGVADAMRRCSDPMVRRVEIDRVLWSRYDHRWRGRPPRARTEDQARVALCWSMLSLSLHDPRYLNAAMKLNDDLGRRQLLGVGAAGDRGLIVDRRRWPLIGPRLARRSAGTAAFCRSLVGESLAMSLGSPTGAPRSPPGQP